MADRHEDRYRGDEYRGERGYGREDRGFMERTGDEVRSWFGDEEAERRRRMDERDREQYRERDFGRDYGPGGERWRGEERWRGREELGGGRQRDYGITGYRGEAGFGTRYGGGYTGTYAAAEDYPRSYGGRYGFGWETGRRGEFVGRGPKGYQRSDARINEDVCDRLTDAADVDASNVEVRVNNGEVTLSGSVMNREEKRRAEDLIESISGVREVHNNLRVARSQETTMGTTGTAGIGATAPAGPGTQTRR